MQRNGLKERLSSAFSSAPKRLQWALLLMVVIYIGYTFFVGDDPHGHSRLAREVMIWPVVLGLGGMYLWGASSLNNVLSNLSGQPTNLSNSSQEVRSIFSSKPDWQSWLVVALLVSVASCALMTPFHSTDVFGYINRGWQQVAYGVNPYATTVIMIPDWKLDPMFTNHWIHNPSPYGFVFLHIARWLCLPFEGHYLPTLGVFKWAMALVHLLITVLLWIGLKPSGPQMQWQAVYGYGLNPLILMHHIANGHNDLWMALFLVMAALLVLRPFKCWGWVGVLPMVMMATLVKYAALVVLPITGLWMLVRKQWRALLVGVCLSVLVIVVTGARYLPDWEHFIWVKIGGNASVAHASIPALFWSTYKELSQWVPALFNSRETMRSVLKYGFMAGYAGVYAWLCLSLRCQVVTSQSQHKERPSKQAADSFPLVSELIGLWVLVMALALGVFSFKFYPWYMGMYLPLAFFIPSSSRYGWLRPVLIAVSVGQLLSFTVIGQARFLDVILMLILPIVLAQWVPKTRAALRNACDGLSVT